MKQPLSFQRILNKSKIGVCSESNEGYVLLQNEYCIQYCGNQRGKICTTGCMEYQFASEREGADGCPRVLSRKAIGDLFFDIISIPTQDHCITLLRPTPENLTLSGQSTSLTKMGLTSRELEIAKLMLRGFSNQEICRKLFISKPTLKTHINSINKKLEDRSYFLRSCSGRR